MKQLILAVVLCGLTAGVASAKDMDPVMARELQWVGRDYTGSGSQAPRAMFLDDQYFWVIFHASCPDKDKLELRYFSGRDIDSGEFYDIKQLGFNRQGKVVSEPAAGDGGEPGQFLATFPIDDKLLAVLKPDGSEMEIDAINATGDSWYVGNAEPLYKAALACKS